MTEHEPADELSPSEHRSGHHPHADWNPRSSHVRDDAVAAYDALRARCPVARGPDGAWTVFSHAEVSRVALDPETFSNAVSRHLQIPNGLDGPVHTAYRAAIEPYFTPERMQTLSPEIERVATEVAGSLAVPGAVDAVALGARFAVRAQSAWLGWPADLEDELLTWVADNRDATRGRDPERTAEVARRFDAIIRSLTDARRRAGADAPSDVTTELMRTAVGGRPLSDDEITSILRNWTGGDLGSMALCTGVVVAYLADHPELQDHLRSDAPDRELDAALDEILRIDDPFVSNRRVATRETTLGDRRIAPGDRVVINWTAANRDERIFADGFDPARNAPYNLVYGIGKHVCPGRPLATLELRLLTRALLAATTAIVPDPDAARERSLPPVGGYAVAPVLLT